MMADHSPAPTPAIQFTPPFNDDDADITIRSSDNAHFRVHTLILKKASPVFSDMLQMSHGVERETLHTVELTEDGDTLTQVLQSCYMNLDFPEIDTLDQLAMLLDVCDKYQMIGVARRLAEAMLGSAFDTTEPLRVLTLAYRAQAARSLLHAAQQCLCLSQVDLIHSDVDLRSMLASTYRYLLRYHDRCRRVAVEILSSTEFLWLTDNYCWLAKKDSITGVAYHDPCCLLGKYVQVGAAGAKLPVRKWWMDLVETVISWLAQQGTTSSISPKLQASSS